MRLTFGIMTTSTMNNITNLSHEELVSLYKQGKIRVTAEMSVSMHLCDRDPRIPGHMKAAHHFWKWIGIILLVGGLISFFFISWYWSLLIFFLSFPVMNATRQSAGQFVSEACIENSSLYYDCLQAGVILITEK